MTVSVNSFLAAYPEFQNAGDTLLTAQLALAEVVVSSDSFGAQRDLAVMLTLADRLATSPSGRDARMTTEDRPASTYSVELERLKAANAVRALRMGVDDGGIRWTCR
jgi:hypothetical protein